MDQVRDWVERPSIVACLMLFGAMVCVLGAARWPLNAWLPSLACNLLTTGAAIYLIDHAAVKREERNAKARDGAVVLLYLRAIADAPRQLRGDISREGSALALTKCVHRSQVLQVSLTNYLSRVASALTPDTLVAVNRLVDLLGDIEDAAPDEVESKLEGLAGLAKSVWRQVHGEYAEDLVS